MNYRSILSNFSVALVAQGLSTVVGLVTSLLVPKLLGVEQFGYWQLFIFYASYMSIFTLGLNDGVYLIEGGKTRSEIDRTGLKSQFLVEFLYQLLFGGIIAAVAFLGFFEADRSFVLVMTAVYLILNNTTNFFGYLFQAMNESKLYSFSTMLNAGAFLIPLFIMLALGDGDFRHYVLWYTAARLLSLGYSLYHGRDVLTAGVYNLAKTLSLCWTSIRAGIKLLFATTAGLLILGIARFVVDANWGIEEFSIVSLAVSITSFVMTLVSQASMVLFPALRRAEDEETVGFFCATRDGLDCLLPLTYVLYAPLAAILTWWLPQYEASFTLFSLLMPLCVFNSKMGVVGNTFLWALRKEGLLLRINCIAVIISGIFALIGAYVLHSIPFVLLGAVVSVMWRCAYAEYHVEKHFGLSHSRSIAGPIVVSLAFMLLSQVLNMVAAWVFTTATCAAYAWMRRDSLKQMLAFFRH